MVLAMCLNSQDVRFLGKEKEGNEQCDIFQKPEALFNLWHEIVMHDAWSVSQTLCGEICGALPGWRGAEELCSCTLRRGEGSQIKSATTLSCCLSLLQRPYSVATGGVGEQRVLATWRGKLSPPKSITALIWQML